MSPLLIVAILLLVVVVGPTLLQRRAQRDHGDHARRVTSAALPTQPPERTSPAASAAGPAPARRVADPVLGDLTFDGIDAWVRDEELTLGGRAIAVVVCAGPEGPQDLHRTWMQAVLSRYDALEAEARALLVSVLEPLEIGHDDITPWQIMIGPVDAPEVFEGRITYESFHPEIDELYVRSTELWDYLEPHLT